MKKPIVEGEGEVILPRVKYKTVLAIKEETVFTGRTMPVPMVLFEYLTGNEMKVFTIVLRHHREHGCCILKSTAMAKQLGITHISIANIFAKLKNMGLIYFEAVGKKRNKLIDWDTIDVLDKMSAKWKAGGVSALRKKMRDKNINRISFFVSKRYCRTRKNLGERACNLIYDKIVRGILIVFILNTGFFE